jgi:hypothetical protein
MQERFTVVTCGANLNDPDPLLEVGVHAIVAAVLLVCSCGCLMCVELGAVRTLWF